MENGKIKCNLCNEEYSADACKSFTYGRLDVNICRFGHHTNGQLWREKRCDKRKAGVDVEAIFMGAITWAIIGICYMIYSEF
jgi:hypothetical protein